MTIDETIKLAKQHVAAGRQYDAKILYQAVLSQFPNSQPARQGLRDIITLEQHEYTELSEVLELLNAKEYEQAYNRATDLTKKHSAPATAYELLGRASAHLGRGVDALNALKKSILLDGNNSSTHTFLADMLLGGAQFESAIIHYRRALEIDPKRLDTLNNLGVALSNIGHYQQSIECHETALRIRPENADSHNNLAVVYHDSGNYKLSIEHCEKAIKIHPLYDTALHNLGNAQMGLKLFNEAAKSYRRALEISPHKFDVRSKLMLCLSRVCNWDELDIEKEHISEQFHNYPLGSEAPNPWAWLGIFDDPTLHKNISIANAEKYLASRPDLGPINRPDPSKKIRIGYFSADFHDHPTTNLLVSLLENHDRSKFEVHAFSFGPDRDMEIRNRVVNGVDHFHKVASKTDLEIAQLSRELKIDIAVDINGHTANKRSGIFTYRAAPVQVNYLGFTSTMGTDDMDYIIADEIVIPKEQQCNFTEKTAYMPLCYMSNDNDKPISSPGLSRQECNLPKDAFVFCCFNNSFKITSDVFKIWMRLMQKVDNSVLWLFHTNTDVDAQLKKYAEESGIDGERIIFAPRVESHADHLSRHNHANLFLDTSPYNAHATTSDALWSGLPVVTFTGKSFTARVASSLLNAIDMPELITQTPEEYENLALELATDKKLLSKITKKVKANVRTSKLYDPAYFARDIENLFEQMVTRAANGELPVSLSVNKVF